MSDKLLPCPFCGGDARELPPSCNKSTPYDPLDRAFPKVRCISCHAETWGRDWDESCESAIAAWNTRAAPAREVVVDEAMVERGCAAVAARDGIDWHSAEWQQSHKIEAGRLRTRTLTAITAALEADR